MTNFGVDYILGIDSRKITSWILPLNFLMSLELFINNVEKSKDKL